MILRSLQRKNVPNILNTTWQDRSFEGRISSARSQGCERSGQVKTSRTETPGRGAQSRLRLEESIENYRQVGAAVSQDRRLDLMQGQGGKARGREGKDTQHCRDVSRLRTWEAPPRPDGIALEVPPIIPALKGLRGQPELRHVSKINTKAGEMTRWLRALALSEDLGSVPSTHAIVPSHL